VLGGLHHGDAVEVPRRQVFGVLPVPGRQLAAAPATAGEIGAARFLSNIDFVNLAGGTDARADVVDKTADA
jgi:hypothetical protein